MEMPAPDSLFTGLKVLDLASFIAGPAATTILADFGADVIKVEPPGMGDPYRYFYATPPNPACATNYAWQLTNRNKRSIAIDLKTAAGRGVLHRLVQWADVLVTNYPPKVRAALGLTYAELAGMNERLIYADITGYGLHGPEADKPGFDITAYWARTGLMDVTHDADSPPTLPIPGIGDNATAVTLYAAIVTALFRRERTGRGGHASTSLIAEGAWAASTWIEGALHGAQFGTQHDRKRPANALLNPYQTADQRWLLLVAAQEKDWPGFVQAMGMPELRTDARFATKQLRVAHAADLVALLDPVFASAPLEDWRGTLDAARVIFGVVQTFDEVIRDPQMLANDILVPMTGSDGAPTLTVNSPLTLAGSPKVPPRLAPTLGQHSRAVLMEMGYVEADIAALQAAGAVACEELPEVAVL